MPTTKIPFTINSLEKRNNSFKTLFTIPVNLESTKFSSERVKIIFDQRILLKTQK